jgi:O-antigen biosynthesis protein
MAGSGRKPGDSFRPSHLRKCRASLEEHTTYPNYEVVILDNGSTERETLGFLKFQAQNPQISILRFPGEFNYSAINNAGVNAAKGSIVCLLNDDTEATTSGWLSEMVGQLWQPEVGVVGAMLLYPDQTIQHAGVVTGIGGFAGHGHKQPLAPIMVTSHGLL